jgi:hypothetical protein
MTQIKSNHPLVGNLVIFKWLHETKNKAKQNKILNNHDKI